jgi:acyl-CoA thioesterase FadM
VTTGQIVAVVVDPETQKPVRVPEELRQAVRKYEE